MEYQVGQEIGVLLMTSSYRGTWHITTIERITPKGWLVTAIGTFRPPYSEVQPVERAREALGRREAEERYRNLRYDVRHQLQRVLTKVNMDNYTSEQLQDLHNTLKQL